jgi:hypothetical protein
MSRTAFLLVLLLLVACQGNHDPSFLSFNGHEVRRDIFGNTWVDGEFWFTPGEGIRFEVEVIDQDGDEVALWWPKAPPGFTFPPEAREGRWEVPEDFAVDLWDFWLVAVDDAEESGASALEIPFYNALWGGGYEDGPEAP